MIRTLSIIGVLAACATGMHGCNVLGPIAYLVHGPPKVDAVYKLDPDRATVIFVDDVSSRLPSRSVRGEIANSAQKYLLREDCLKDLIDYRPALLAASSDRSGTALSIIEIGESVKADVIIYVMIEDFGISPDGQSYSPFAYAKVKVMDVKSQKRIWPADERGHPVQMRPNPQTTTAPTTVGGRLESSRLLAAELGHAVAQLFYTHEANNAAGRDDLKKAEDGPFNDPT
jgi:hypothetical protein